MKPESLESDPTASDKNVVPSMVVRQQRMQMGQLSANQRAAQQPQQSQRARSADEVLPTSSSIKAANELSGHVQQQFDQDGLVLPKRLVHHTVPPVAQPIIRDLNRELKFNQVRGKNVLDQKSELKKALEKLEESKRRKEAEQERLNRRSSLELRLEERAERIAKETAQSTDSGQSSSTSGGATKTTTTTTCNPMGNFRIKPISR